VQLKVAEDDAGGVSAFRVPVRVLDSDRDLAFLDFRDLFVHYSL
jgi:hypothetical protein